jgi:hypothetical protein
MAGGKKRRGTKNKLNPSAKSYVWLLSRLRISIDHADV